MIVPHTPGPHSVVQDGMGNNHIVSRWAPDAVTEARWTFLAEVKTPSVDTVLYKNGKEHTVLKGEELANANLFGAAERMLSALILGLMVVEEVDTTSKDAMETLVAFKFEARRAIRAAKGEK